MKTKLIVLLLVLVALVCTFAACGESAETTAEGTTTAPAVITTAPVTTTIPVTTTQAPVTTTPIEGEDAMAAYEFMSEKMSALLGFELTMLSESSVGVESFSQEGSVKINLADGKKVFMSMQLEDNSVVDATYIDGVVYCLVKMPGIEMKYKTQDQSMTSSFETIFTAFETEEDGENKVATVEFVKRENGVYTLFATATKEAALASIMKDYEGIEDDPSAFSNISNTMTFECTADGYVTKSVETLTYTYAGEVCSEVTTLTFKNAGTLPEITLPADADSYMNMDEMQ